MKLSAYKLQTSISFKQAVGIVIGLHIAGGAILYSWASYRREQARIDREAKTAVAAANYNPNSFWGNRDIKLKVVAVPSPVTALKQTTKPGIREVIVDRVSGVIVRFKENVDRVIRVLIFTVKEVEETVEQIGERVETREPVKQQEQVKVKPPVLVVKRDVPVKREVVREVVRYEEVQQIDKQPQVRGLLKPRVVPMRVVAPPPPPPSHPKYYYSLNVDLNTN